ncbi:MAG: protein phosphatase 2C domain-containing protein [Oscillatoriales cyanobacterium]|nr:MAG: protein phosphatase 2C domain-containing protein [Oscillatoriales cyanobacterium]
MVFQDHQANQDSVLTSADRNSLVVPLVPEGIKAIALSVAGSRHRRAGEPCQDASGWRAGPGWAIAVVADGAGSALDSAVGAQLAVDHSLDTLQRLHQRRSPQTPANWVPLLRVAVRSAKWAVERKARDRQQTPRELACTLIVAIALPTGVAIAQIGDGAVVVRDRTGSFTTLSQPEQGEFANETRFLVEPGTARSPQIQLWAGDWVDLALFSDGLQRLALQEPDRQPFTPFFSPLFQFLAVSEDLAAMGDRLTTFLQSDRIADRTDDDLTLLLMHREA